MFPLFDFNYERGTLVPRWLNRSKKQNATNIRYHFICLKILSKSAQFSFLSITLCFDPICFKVCSCK